jgi:hypothetical protein
MRKIRSDSGRHVIIEHDVLSPETGKVTYVMRGVTALPIEELEECESPSEDESAPV